MMALFVIASAAPSPWLRWPPSLFLVARRATAGLLNAREIVFPSHDRSTSQTRGHSNAIHATPGLPRVLGETWLSSLAL